MEVNVIEIDNESYIIIGTVELNNNKYLVLSNEKEHTEVIVRKVVCHSDREFLELLDSEEEYDIVLKEFYNRKKENN